MKTATIIIFIILISTQGYSQKINSFCYNDSIKYTFGYVGMKFLGNGKAIPFKYLLNVDLDSTQKSKLKKIHKLTWLNLLMNKKTDWASNLLLYYLYKKDAIEFVAVIKNRKDWILTEKNKKNLKHWSRIMKSNTSSLPYLSKEINFDPNN